MPLRDVLVPHSMMMTWLAVIALGAPQANAEALAFGRGGCGRLEGGVKLPASGANFEVFAETSAALGRTYVHPLVAKAVADAYAALAGTFPDRVWQYGETGTASGGNFWPHRSHQNGLAVDFFVPVVGADRKPARVPISFCNKLGYGLEFDREGRLDDLRID